MCAYMQKLCIGQEKRNYICLYKLSYFRKDNAEDNHNFPIGRKSLDGKKKKMMKPCKMEKLKNKMKSQVAIWPSCLANRYKKVELKFINCLHLILKLDCYINLINSFYIYSLNQAVFMSSHENERERERYINIAYFSQDHNRNFRSFLVQFIKKLSKFLHCTQK